MTQETMVIAIDTPTLEDLWKDKLRVLPGRIGGYAHYRKTVEILSGNPPNEALFLAANDWQDSYFGGAVDYKYRAEDDGGQEHRYAVVKVYTD